MKHSLFWAAVEAAAKATRSGLSVVGALVDCGIPRQHAGEQWLTEKEAEEDVAEPQAEMCHCGHAFAEHRVTAYGMTSAINCGGRKDYGDGMEECFCTRWFALAAIPADVQPFPGQKPHPRSPAAEVWEEEASADFKDECCGLPDCGWCYDQSPVAMQAAADSVRREDEAWSSGWKRGWASATEAYAVFQDRNTPKDSRTNAGATSSRAVEEGLTEETPPVSSVSAAINYRGEQLSWCEYVQPAILDVLADHIPTPWHFPEMHRRGVQCFHADGDLCADLADLLEHREHVAPLIAERLEAVTLALPEEA